MMPDLRKPAKGSGFIARKTKRKAIEADEDRNKAIVRKRDQRCRWPHCEYCRTVKPRLEVCHVIRAKGMGGDQAGTASEPNALMLLDFITHGEQEQHRRDVIPIHDELGTDGPCEFWMEDERGEMVLVAREREPFTYERD
jgi:hypothetical protein